MKINNLLRQTCPITILLFILFFMSGCSINSEGSSYYKEGMKAFNKQQFEEASEKLEKATLKNPDKAEYYIAYGMCLIEIAQYDKALENFDKAISKKTNQIVLENNKQAYRGKGICNYFARNYDESLKWFDKALEIRELSNLNMDILQYKGKVQCERNDFQGAVKTYTDLIDKKGYNSSYYMQRAFAYSKDNKMSEALKDYDTVIKNDKSEFEAYIGAYLVLAENAKEDDGQAYLNKALENNKPTEDNAIDIAKIQYYQGNKDSAMEGLKEVSKNGNLEADFYLGKIYMDEKKYKEAIPYFEKFIRNDVNTTLAEAYNLMGMCYYNLEEYEKALEQFEAGIQMNDAGFMQQILKNEIITYEHLGDYDNASKKAENYVSLYKEDKDMQKELEFMKTRLKSVSK